MLRVFEPNWKSLEAKDHRGQFSMYIRPMGGRVPPIYGPSADSR